MKKEIADKWVEALRSGKYKQGKYALKMADTYCCLGVLCDISCITRFEPNRGNSYLGQVSNLPEKVQSWAGMRSKDGELNSHSTLAYLNDTGASFEQIADIIEKNQEVL